MTPFRWQAARNWDVWTKSQGSDSQTKKSYVDVYTYTTCIYSYICGYSYIYIYLMCKNENVCVSWIYICIYVNKNM